MGNQHLQFTAEIWMTDTKLPLPEKEDKVQVVTNDEVPFLDMKIIWSPERDLQFSVFRKMVKKLKYVRMGGTHTTGTLHAIPLAVLNRLAIITFAKTLPSF